MSIVKIVQITLKSATLAICGFVAFGGHYPPARAQRSRYAPQVDIVPVLTVKDSQQDDAIVELRGRAVSLEARLSKQWDATTANTTAIAGMQGENRVWFAILGLLSSGSLVLTVTSGKKRNAE